MADFAKALVKAVYSQNSDYADPDTDTNYDEYEITPDEVLSSRVDAETGGGTVAMAANALASITLMIIINTHASNVVTATFTNANGADSITIAGGTGITEYGSPASGSPVYSTDPDAIQTADWLTGWAAAANRARRCTCPRARRDCTLASCPTASARAHDWPYLCEIRLHR